MLTKEQIIYYLESIREHQMAKEIFVPVLKRMGLKGVKFTGGPDEIGVDIEYYEVTQPENNKSYVGIQFKKGDLTYGSGGSKGTVKEVRNQAEEAFEKEIHDIEEKSTLYIGRFIVAVTGDINEKARTFIGKARQKGFDRRIDYWTGDRLAEYIQDHWIDEFIEYFDIDSSEELDDEFDSQIVNEDYIEENYEELIEKCRRLKVTVSVAEYKILTTLAKLEINNQFSSGVPLAEFLFEMRKPEEYIRSELDNLINRLQYIGVDDTDLYLSDRATSLRELLEKISDEIIEAEEADTVNAVEIFSDVLK
ncbi:hypothetical protein N7917_10770 [Bacillus sp. OR9]|nr:hypothetical protein [Bacillus sp. OR9]